MSYHLELEKTGKVPDIAMPPLAPEPMPQQQYNVHPDIARDFSVEAPEQEEVEQVAPQVDETPEPEATRPAQETQNAKNIRYLREKAERADQYERERNELIQKLSAYEQNKTTPTEVDPTVDPEDFVSGKHLNKYDRKIKQLEEQLQKNQYQAQLNTTEVRLRSEFTDFDKVVSMDNLEQLKLYYPEIADTIHMSNADLYSKGKSAYNMIKQLGIVKPEINEMEKLKAQKNSLKPKPLASISPQQGESPLAKANAFANGLTDELKKQLRKEMEDARMRI